MEFERLSRVVVDQEPVRPAARCQGFQDGRNRPVAAALGACRTHSQSLPQLYQRVSDAIGMLGADPPDYLVFISVPVNIFGCYFGFTDATHAGNKLGRRMRAVVAG